MRQSHPPDPRPRCCKPRHRPFSPQYPCFLLLLYCIITEDRTRLLLSPHLSPAPNIAAMTDIDATSEALDPIEPNSSNMEGYITTGNHPQSSLDSLFSLSLLPSHLLPPQQLMLIGGLFDGTYLSVVLYSNNPLHLPCPAGLTN